jgi:hypothetical protein
MPPTLSPAAKRQAVEALRARLGPVRPPSRDVLSFSELPSGVSKGGLTEVFGAPGGGKAEFVARLLAEHPAEPAAWIEAGATFSPAGLPCHGVRLDRLLLIEAGAELEWTALQVLRSGLFKIVVLNPQAPCLPLRRLQAGAEAAKAALLLLGDGPLAEDRWALSASIQVQRSLRLHSPDPIRWTDTRKQLPWKQAVNM